MTISPSRRGVPGEAFGRLAGNDSTLVAEFFCRQSRLSVLIAASSVRTMETSPPVVAAADAAATIARLTSVLALRSARQRTEATMTSIAGGPARRCGLR